ncbi:MAG: hypothetical protein H6943_02465 [Zoogloeaceae bacterium]|nr:hypothetical protein [Zoogloeaceae bacterium]
MHRFAESDVLREPELASSSSKRNTSTPRRTRSRLRFIAAVRFANGQRGNFSIDNAHDLEEARRMVFDELEEVATVLITSYR